MKPNGIVLLSFTGMFFCDISNFVLNNDLFYDRALGKAKFNACMKLIQEFIIAPSKQFL